MVEQPKHTEQGESREASDARVCAGSDSGYSGIDWLCACGPGFREFDTGWYRPICGLWRLGGF